MLKNAPEPFLVENPLGPCICSQLRRTARKISSLYDQALSAAGLTITQYALLVNIARADEVSRSALAVQVGMDRTTLTRNLKPLEKSNLVVSAESADRRERLLRLSPKGQRRLKQGIAHWEKAQNELIVKLGPDALSILRHSLTLAETAAAAHSGKSNKP
jgi:DNA-binding MarR family transcriptional regulator